MRFVRLLRVLLPLVLLAGCCPPGGRRVDLVRAATVPGSTRIEPVAIAIAPIARGVAWRSGSRTPSGLLLTAPNAGFVTADLAPLGSPGIVYPTQAWEWREISLPPAALTRVVDAMLANPRFAGKQLTPDTALSVRVLRRERGCVVLAEVFVEVGAAHEFAARLTNAGMGTDALRALLQWEMNL